MTRVILKFVLIIKTPEVTFKGVQIESEGGVGRPLGQNEPPPRKRNIYSTYTTFVDRGHENIFWHHTWKKMEKIYV